MYIDRNMQYKHMSQTAITVIIIICYVVWQIQEEYFNLLAQHLANNAVEMKTH